LPRRRHLKDSDMPRATTENVTLEDVEQNGDVLLLADGRRLEVSPDDATVTSIWQPSTRLMLREGKGKGWFGRSAFDLSVTNDETGQTIAAKLRARSG
jgi:hypothetical protein